MFGWGNDAKKKEAECWIQVYNQFYPILNNTRKKMEGLYEEQFRSFDDFLRGKRTYGAGQLSSVSAEHAKLGLGIYNDAVPKEMNRLLTNLRIAINKTFLTVEAAWQRIEDGREGTHFINALSDDEYAALRKRMLALLYYKWKFLALIDGSEAVETTVRETLPADQFMPLMKKQGCALLVGKVGEKQWEMAFSKEWVLLSQDFRTQVDMMQGILTAHRNS